MYKPTVYVYAVAFTWIMDRGGIDRRYVIIRGGSWAALHFVTGGGRGQKAHKKALRNKWTAPVHHSIPSWPLVYCLGLYSHQVCLHSYYMFFVRNYKPTRHLRSSTQATCIQPSRCSWHDWSTLSHATCIPVMYGRFRSTKLLTLFTSWQLLTDCWVVKSPVSVLSWGRQRFTLTCYTPALQHARRCFGYSI